MDDLIKGIKNKVFHRGVLRCRGGGRLGFDDCYIVVHSETSLGGKKKTSRWSISITGRDRVNRALDGDVVAVELINSEEMENQKIIVSPETESSNVVLAEETATPSAAALEGLQTAGY